MKKEYYYLLGKILKRKVQNKTIASNTAFRQRKRNDEDSKEGEAFVAARAKENIALIS